MRYFPMFLDLRDRPVLIAGGGEQAAQKARLILRAGPRIAVMAPALEPELAALAAEGRVRHVPAVYDEAEVDRAVIAFCASGCVGVDAWISARVRARGGVVNVVDKPRLCTAITPALVDRDPLVVAIGTEGVAPVMAQRVKTMAEGWLEPGLGDFLAELAALRPVMAETALSPDPRRFWNWIMDGPRARAAAGDLDGAVAEVRAAIAAGAAPQGASEGRLTLIALPAEGADLLPLRAVRRLQEADLLAHAPDAPAAALELARRDAERLSAAAPPAAEIAARVAGGEAVAALIPPAGWDAAVAAMRAEGMSPELLFAGRAV
ncbi:MAG: bifunctional precorrin-2 dehydrogenase/sirohydrochlorin ferrochelatase [Pseudomonadota bacterium]|nr:bifunctional precorrin-2 dehydrogenase/sirohydrochlorin ferrochelatase [Pseudomonadota bacterium]